MLGLSKKNEKKLDAIMKLGGSLDIHIARNGEVEIHFNGADGMWGVSGNTFNKTVSLLFKQITNDISLCVDSYSEEVCGAEMELNRLETHIAFAQSALKTLKKALK